jgi:hypothetical protein
MEALYIDGNKETKQWNTLIMPSALSSSERFQGRPAG